MTHQNPGSSLQDDRIDHFFDSSKRVHPVLEEITGVFKFSNLIFELIARNIKIRYKRSILGVAWTMINPLLTMLVLTVVFSQLFHLSLPNYSVYLLSGLLLWNFFAQSTIACIKDLMYGGGILRNLRIPKSVFAIAAIGTGIVNISLSLVPLALIMFIEGIGFHWQLIFIPIAILICSIFTLGIGLLVSSLSIGFADVGEMYQIFLLAWMYLTPIFYPPEILADKYVWIVKLNPMFYILKVFRSPIYSGEFPETNVVVVALISAVLSLVIGGYLFAKKSDKIPYLV